MAVRQMNERTFRTENAHKLEDPERLKWLPVDAVLEDLDIREGIVVADIGAGMGYFAIPIARAIGPTGKVLAVDLQQEMLDLLRQKLAATPEITNIELFRGSAEATSLPDGCSDLVLMANLWHELDNHPDVLAEAQRILKPEGRLAVLDWRADLEPPPGPAPQHRISAAQLYIQLEDAGWAVDLTDDIGSYHHLMVARPGA